MGDAHALALSNANEAYAWGNHTTEKYHPSPRKVAIRDVADIGAIRGCSISALTTNEGKVYFWGFAYGHFIRAPVLTKFDSMTELFASLDSPMMLKPVELDVKPSIGDKLRSSFDDKVRTF